MTRRTQRSSLSLPVSFVADSRLFSSRAIELTAHGAFLVTDSRIRCGSLLNIQFSLDDGRFSLCAGSRVVSCTGLGVGVEFTDLMGPILAAVLLGAG